MRRLILFRHAKAVPATAGDDRARPLSETGRADAAAMGLWLAAEGLAPDLALVSNSARTRETWDLARPAFGEARLDILDDLYDAGPQRLARIWAEVGDEAAATMIVGHNPGLQAFALDLLKKGAHSAGLTAEVSSAFPPAMAVAFTFDAAGRPVFDGLFNPRRAPTAAPARDRAT